MFSFCYKNKYINVYFIDEKFFFKFDEINPLLRPYFKSRMCREEALKVEKKNNITLDCYMGLDETLVYINNFLFCQDLEDFIFNEIFPVLKKFKDAK